MIVHGVIATPLGPIVKIMTFHADSPRIDFQLEFQWESWGRGALRLGHITLLGEAFDEQSLSFTTTNGGAPERFALAGQTVEHGAPVSFLVSAACAVGTKRRIASSVSPTGPTRTPSRQFGWVSGLDSESIT